jgi:hypothetical protein
VTVRFQAETSKNHNLVVWARQRSKVEKFRKAGKLLKAAAVN